MLSFVPKLRLGITRAIRNTMSTRTVIASPSAPPAIGPYSQGIRTGSFVFLSGQIPLVNDTGKFVDGGIREQTEQVIANIKALLGTQGLGLADVVKSTVFLADMNEFATMNEVYASHFAEPFPARSTVQVARLPRDARVEIEVIAQAR
jgi:2-iminobutanoate/2-iminopropanoate deaminase